MVRCSDCTLGCKACAFQYLFAGRSSDICSFWPIQQNSSFTSVPVRSPIYWTEPETSPFPALHICTEIHAGAQIHTHRSLWSWRNSWRRRGQSYKDAPTHNCRRIQPQGNIGPLLADTRLHLAAIQTMEWDSPGGGSSPNESQQCSVGFAVICDLALGADLVPPLPGPCQLDIFHLGVHSRSEAHLSSSEYCPLFSPKGHMNLIIPP